MVHFWKISYSKVTPHFHTWAIIICNNMTSFLVKMSFFGGVLVFYFSVFEIEKGCVTLLTKNCSATWANWKNWSCKSWENASASIFFWQWFLLTTGALGYIPLVERREISIFTHNILPTLVTGHAYFRCVVGTVSVMPMAKQKGLKQSVTE